MSNCEVKTTKPSYKSCFVPKCKNTTIKTPQKTFIYVPKDEKTRKSWCKAAGHKGPLSINSYICEDHFNLPEDLENYLEWKLTKCRKRLKPEVHPRFFLYPAESLKKAKKKKHCSISSTISTFDENNHTEVKHEDIEIKSEDIEIKSEHSISLISSNGSIREFTSSPAEFSACEFVHSPHKIPILKVAIPSQFSRTAPEYSTLLKNSVIRKNLSQQDQTISHKKTEKQLSLTDFATRIKVPLGWALQCLPAKFPDILSIHERCYTTTDNLCKTFTRKEIIVKKNWTLQVSILEENIPLEVLCFSSIVETTQQLQDIVCALDKFHICSGSHKPGTMLPIFCKSVKKDVADNWRHVNCSLLVINSDICDCCLEAKKIVGICS